MCTPFFIHSTKSLFDNDFTAVDDVDAFGEITGRAVCP